MKSKMKQTIIGEIPDDWEVVKVGEVFQRVTRKNAEGNTNALTISAQMGLISQTEFFNKTVASSNLSGYYLLHNGDFAYNKSYSNGYPMGVIKRLDRYDKGVVSTLYICFNLIDEESDSSFYTQYFEAGYFNDQLASIAQEGARAHGLLNVGVKDFFNLLVVKPPLPEQQKIAKILSTMDEKMAVIDEQIARTQELKKGLMQRLLTRGIGHTAFKDSPLGEIPESWKVSLLDSVAKRGSGHTPSKGFPEYYDGSIKWISLGDSNKLDKGWIKETKTSISPLGIKNSSAVQHPKGTVLLSRDAGVGKSAIMYEDMAVSQHFITWNCSESLNNWFLYYFLQKNKPYFERIAAGSTIKTIGLPFFKKFLITIPPIMEQELIADILTTVDEKLQVLTDKKGQYQELKRGLMQQLLTGQRRVRMAAELATVAY